MTPARFDPAAALDTVLRRLAHDSATYFASRHVRLTVLRRSEREGSVVLQVRVEDAPGAPEIFVKVFKPRDESPEHTDALRARVVNDFTTTARIHQQMATLDGFSAVRPIACFPDLLALVTERVHGQTLAALLERAARWGSPSAGVTTMEQTLSRAGAWIRTFQAGSPANGVFSLVGMREYVDVRLRRLTGMPRAAFPERWRTGVLRYFDRRSAEVAADDLGEVAVHADIAPGNVLANGDHIIVIDFAMATTGGRYHDVARLHSQLDFLKCKPTFKPSVVANLQAKLVDGFEPGLSASHPLFELFLVQHVLCHLANLSSHPGAGVSRAYNWYQRHQHRRWLARTCSLPSA